MLVCLAFFVEKGGGKKKLTEFNKFMQTEIARLKEENPEMPHRERCVFPPSLFGVVSSASSDDWVNVHRFKQVVENWNKKKEKA